MDFILFGFHLNNKSIVEKDDFPVKKQIVVSSEKDQNIEKNISLSSLIDIDKNKKNIEMYESKDSGHFDIKYKEVFKILDNTSIDDKKFIKVKK